jgi:hypothetical protein
MTRLIWRAVCSWAMQPGERPLDEHQRTFRVLTGMLAILIRGYRRMPYAQCMPCMGEDILTYGAGLHNEKHINSETGTLPPTLAYHSTPQKNTSCKKNLGHSCDCSTQPPSSRARVKARLKHRRNQTTRKLTRSIVCSSLAVRAQANHLSIGVICNHWYVIRNFELRLSANSRETLY